MDGLISRKEAAQRLGLTEGTLARWGTQRIGPIFIRIGRKVFYREETFLTWINEQEARKLQHENNQHKNG